MISKKAGAGRWIIIAILLIAVAATAYAVLSRKSGPRLEHTIVEPIERGNFEREISGTGIIEAKQERNLNFKTAGNVLNLFVAEGDDVTANQLLAQLDTSSLERDISSNQANLVSAKAELARTRAQENIDKLDSNSSLKNAQIQEANALEAFQQAERSQSVSQQLFDAGAASQNELDAANDALARAQRQLEQAKSSVETALARKTSFNQLKAAQTKSAEARIEQLETTIANAQARLEEAKLYAPFAGTITAIDFEQGDSVSQANKINLVNIDSLNIAVKFDENRALELRQGQTATITPDANSSQKLAAIVTKVSPIAIRQGNTAQIESDLEFTEAITANSVRPGYTVTAKVLVNHLEDVFLIPLEAITEKDDTSFIYKVVEDSENIGQGKVEKVEIEVLDRNATIAAAKASNLKTDDFIALINLDNLEDGDLVDFEPPKGDS